MDERSLRFRRNGNVLSTDNDAAFIPLSGLRIRMEELHPFRYSSVPVHALYAVFLFPSFPLDNKKAAILAAIPRQIVETSLLIKFIVS